ncbi:phage tail tape measure protein, partial [Bacillus mycoides]
MTMYEDQGQNIINTLLGAKEKTVDFGKQQDKLNDSIKKMDANPAVKFQKVMQDLQVALQPVLSVIADVISKIAEWVSNNPKLAATLTAVAMAIGIISGAIMALAPIVMTVMSFFEIGALAAAGLVAIVPIIIAAIVALGIAIYKNWASIKQWTIDTWNSIKEYLIELW